MQEKKIYPQANEAGERLDIYLTRVLALSRSMVKRIIDDGGVHVEGQSAKPSQSVNAGEEIVVWYKEPSEASAKPQVIPLDILYEDGDLIVVNKPRGMVVHPAAGNPDGTLVNALLAHCIDLSGVGGVLRPGIVHRLDKDTSGVIVAAKTDRAHLGLAAQFHDHTIERRYIAIVHGCLKPSEGTISGPIGRHPRRRTEMAVVAKGRRAVTHYRCLEQMDKYAKIEARLETGRTHQIRVHLSHIGHPLVGDAVYGRSNDKAPIDGQALHAAILGFSHPVTGRELRFETCLPEAMKALEDWCKEQ